MRPASRAPMLAPSIAYDPVLFVAADVRPSKATSVATSIVYLLEAERPQERSHKRAGAEAEDVAPHSGRGRGRPPGDLRGCPAGYLGLSAGDWLPDDIAIRALRPRMVSTRCSLV